WKDFPLPQDSSYIRTFAQDTAGNIWAGTPRGILLRLHGSQISDETTNVFGIPTSVRAICATPDGWVWFACAGGGLAWSDSNGHTGRIMAEQGLADNYLSQIVADDGGYLWFGSDHGIFKANEQVLKSVAEGKSSHVQCIQYGRNVGLPGLQATSGHWPMTAKSRDGLLWMAMSTGLAVIDPRNSEGNSNPPPVLLKRVVMDEEIVADYGNILPAQSPVDLSRAKASLQLPPRHSRLEFDWRALNFSAPENVNFRYQLVGLDASWIDGGTERKANYSRLPAGNYSFKVQARNGDGDWRESSVLGVSVAPFFWQTWWFGTIALLIFTAGVIAVVRYVSFRRLRNRLQLLEQQAALERERARIARDIHDDLGGSLTQITLLSGLAARDDKEKTGEYIQRITATTHQVIRSLDEVVWAINPRNDNLRDMIQYTGQFAIEFLTAANVRCVLDLPQKIPDSSVSAEVRHNFFLVVKETLNNIMRHALATEVKLSAAVSQNEFRMTIADNGQGFKKENADAFANGVRNMQQRMDEIHGGCDIESISGKGTRVTLSFPLEK
ncbi:MAG TPA: triple tyrosine motif-containing protein, partial [Pyrinomonadaceae bacterium]|nr:triple tyrosine motif-containing protein [Pyrinomonadaceae bacterium]